MIETAWSAKASRQPNGAQDARPSAPGVVRNDRPQTQW